MRLSATGTILLSRTTLDPRVRGSRLADLGALLARDAGLTATLAVAVGVSLVSVAYFAHIGLLTAYGDGKARLLIARMVLEGRQSGLAQLGGIWPPFPQAYMLAFAWNDALYYTGVAGAIPSALSYVIASAFLYKLVVRLTGDQMAGLIGVLAFSGPNTLYLQSVPMSELPFIACFVAAVYFTVRWIQDDSLGALFMAALAACLSTLTRYEGWVLVVLLTAVVVIAGWRGSHRYSELEGLLVFFGLVAFFGIGLWLIWNRVILGDTLYFLHSQYGTAAINGLQVSVMASADRPAGRLRLSSVVFGWTAADTIGWIAVALGVLGLLRLAIARRSVPNAVAALLLLFPVAFSVMAVYAGAEVVADPHATPGEPATNLRYGLLLAPAAGFLAGSLAGGRWLRWPTLAACVASSMVMWHTGLADPREAAGMTAHYDQATRPAAEWLHGHYDNGIVLMQRRTNENLLFASHLPLSKVVYEGDRGEWTADLRDPAREVRWIVMDAGTPSQAAPPDDVWRQLHSSPQLRDRYLLAYQNGPISVYRLGDP